MELEIKQSFCATANLTMQNCSVKIGQSQLNADTGKGNRMSRKKDINFFFFNFEKMTIFKESFDHYLFTWDL